MKPSVGKIYWLKGEKVRITNLYSDTNLPNGAGRFTLPTWDGYVEHPNPNKRHIRAGRDQDIEKEVE